MVGILQLGIYSLVVIDMIFGCIGENEIVVEDIWEFLEV